MLAGVLFFVDWTSNAVDAPPWSWSSSQGPVKSRGIFHHPTSHLLLFIHQPWNQMCLRRIHHLYWRPGSAGNALKGPRAGGVGRARGETLGERRVVFAYWEGGHPEGPKSSILGCGHSDTFSRIEESHQTLIAWILYGKTWSKRFWEPSMWWRPIERLLGLSSVPHCLSQQELKATWLYLVLNAS